MRFTRTCVLHPLTAWVLMVGLCLVGGLALSRIGISQYPDVDRMEVSAQAELPGASPEVMERDVCEVIEDALMQGEGIKQVRSSVRSGRADITIELQPGRDVDAAVQDAQNRISRIAQKLPSDLPPVQVSKSNPEDRPVVQLALTGPYSRQVLADVARYTVSDALQTVPGVGQITIFGPQQRAVRVWLDRDRLEAWDLTVGEVMQALKRNSLDASGGTLETPAGDLGVRVLGQPGRIEDLLSVAIVTRSGTAGGAPAVVRLGEVATVEDGFVEERRINRWDGVPRQGLGVAKQRGANAVAMAEGVQAAIDRLQPTLPAGMRLETTWDSSVFIKQSLQSMWHELGLAVLLTALVCWICLGAWWAALSVLLAIPMALMGTVGVLWGWGATLNTFTLLGLALAIGLVVDDAIMVQESIDRHRTLGLSPRDAAMRGTRAVAFAALAATVAVLAVFAPVLFMGGEIGASFLQFGIALCAAVAFSYLEAVTLAPARAAQFMGSHHAGVPRFWAPLERVYGSTLDLVLRRPTLVLATAVVLCSGGGWLLLRLPRELAPPQDTGRLEGAFTVAATVDQDGIDDICQRIEAIALSTPGVEHIQVNTSISTGRAWFYLVPPEKRGGQERILQDLRRQLATIPGLTIRLAPSSEDLIRLPEQVAVDVSIRGPDHARCGQVADAILRRWRDEPRLVEASTSRRIAAAELIIEPDRAAAADLGVEVDELAATVNSLIGGGRAGSFTLGGRQQEVRVRLLAAQRATPDDLGRLRVRTRTGATVPLAAVAHVRLQPAALQLDRRNREPAVILRANAAAGVTAEEAQRIADGLIGDLPVGYRAVPGENTEAVHEAVGSLLFALVAGIIAAYLVLVVQFDSLRHPITVLSVMPLAITGAAVALVATGQTVNVYSGIGLLLLMGLAKKNSILLVDRANTAMSDGAADARVAMRLAGPARLRPILMTSLATIAAAVPIALGLGAGAEVRRPMAIAIVGGIAISTALSLVVVPALYVVISRRRRG